MIRDVSPIDIYNFLSTMTEKYKKWCSWNIFFLQQDMTNGFSEGIKVAYEAMSEIKSSNNCLHTYLLNLPSLEGRSVRLDN